MRGADEMDSDYPCEGNLRGMDWGIKCDYAK